MKNIISSHVLSLGKTRKQGSFGKLKFIYPLRSIPWEIVSTELSDFRKTKN